MWNYIIIKKYSNICRMDIEYKCNTLEEARQLASLLNKNHGNNYNSYHIFHLVEEEEQA